MVIRPKPVNASKDNAEPIACTAFGVIIRLKLPIPNIRVHPVTPPVIQTIPTMHAKLIIKSYLVAGMGTKLLFQLARS